MNYSFSKKILDEKWYRQKIKNYLNENNIKNLMKSLEKGIIKFLFRRKPSKDLNIFNIGLRGGACKPHRICFPFNKTNSTFKIYKKIMECS